MEIIDSHIHIGNLSDTDTITPEQVREQLTSWGVSGGLMIPIAKRGGNDNLRIHTTLYANAIKAGFDVALYANPQMLDVSPDLSHFLDFQFKALKIHPDAVIFSDQLIYQVCEIATFLKLPLMIHTGANDCCHAGRFETFIQQYPELKFVLCHARPSDEAFPLMMKYPNVWIDTAFLPFHDLSVNFTKDIEDRILFGTDYPANRWFPHLGDETKWYQQQITSIIKTFPSEVAEKMLCKNYNRLFTK